MPEILFIQPTQYDGHGNLCKQKRIQLPGLVFPLLAAYTPYHWEVTMQIEVVDDIDFNSTADIVAIGTMGHAIYRGLEIAGRFREKGKTVVLGGYMASLAATEAKKQVDSVIIGDAELAYPAMLRDFEETGQVKPFYDMPIDNLDGLPIPRYELLTQKPIGNMLPVQAGRGCPFSCTFCSIACLHKGKYLFRPVDEVVRDIRYVKELGYNRFYLIDDNIASNPAYLLELCKKIAPLKMHWSSQCAILLAKNPALLKQVRLSGCEMMSFGVETISQEALDALNKPWLKVSEHAANIRTLQKSGIVVSTEMILGTDSDTESSIRDTYSFIMKEKIPIPRVYIITPIPGSAFFNELKKNGKLLTEDFYQYNGSQAVHRPDRIEPEKLTEMYWWLNRKMFSVHSILSRVVLNRYLWRNFRMLLFALYINFHYRRYVRKNTVPNIF